MANTFIKSERIVSTMLGVLSREVVLPQLVWRDAGGDFRGAKNDTVSIRLPAYTNANTRTLRAGTPITVEELDETKVDVTLDTDVYKAIGVSLEELTLDVENFERQVAVPATESVARGIEDALATEMNGATYQSNIEIDVADPYLALIDARIALNKANVPPGGRFLAVGSDIEAAILKSDRLSKFDQSGSDTALREASIGRIAGFTAVSVPGLEPDIAVAAHQTAFVLSTRAPSVPQGAVTGATRSALGFSMTAIQDYDFINTSDRFAAHVFMGTNTVMDRGTLDTDGRFVPSADGTATPILVRAVKLVNLV